MLQTICTYILVVQACLLGPCGVDDSQFHLLTVTIGVLYELAAVCMCQDVTHDSDSMGLCHYFHRNTLHQHMLARCLQTYGAVDSRLAL